MYARSRTGTGTETIQSRFAQQIQKPSDLAKLPKLDPFVSVHTPKCGEVIVMDKDGNQTRYYEIKDKLHGLPATKMIPYRFATVQTTESFLATYVEKKEYNLVTNLSEYKVSLDFSSINNLSSDE